MAGPSLQGPPCSSLFDKTTHWFERARASLLDDLPCQQGCHHCCVGLFPVTLLDQQAIEQGLYSLPLHQYQAIQATAARQIALISAAAPQLAGNPFIDEWPDHAIDHLVEEYRHLPCPALQADGSCGVYPFRPLTCRSMGIPTETDSITHGACDVQTSVPLVQVARSLREEEDRLAKQEAEALAALRHTIATAGEELFLPFAFLPLPPETNKQTA
jgi:Fe-S-cluster containining protein